MAGIRLARTPMMTARPMAPRIIRNPMEAIVLPKPSLIVFITLSAGSVVKARKRETRKRAMKALSFRLEVRTIIATMLIATSNEVINMLILLYVKKRYAIKIAVVKPARSASKPHPIEYLVFFIPTDPK